MAINVCVVGYGLSAKIFQIPYILLTPGLQLHSILQRTARPGNDAAKDHPDARIHKSFEDVTADPEIRLAVVSTGNDQHYPMAKALLEAGKDVLVEKPFTVEPGEARELAKLAVEKGRVLTVFHNRRFDADFLTLQRMLASNTFGNVVSLESHFDRFKPDGPKKETWKTRQIPGNGVLFDLGSHVIDQALVLFGLPDRVFASVRDERGASKNARAMWGDEDFVDDAFDALLFYDRRPSARGVETRGGIVVKLSASTTSLCERQLRYVVRGTEAGYVKHGLDPQEDQTKAGMRVEDERFGVEDEEQWGTLTTAAGESAKVPSEKGSYARFFENLAAALEGREAIAVSPSQAADVVHIIKLLGVSSRDGKVQAVEV